MPIETISGDRMPSWREQASQQAQEDLDALLDAALSTAGQALSAEGTFSPFAVVRTVDGVSELVGVVGDDGLMDADAAIAELWGVLRERREDLRAAGVVTDRVSDGTDQVAVELEHSDGTAVQVTLAYAVGGGEFAPGAMAAGVGRSRVW